MWSDGRLLACLSYDRTDYADARAYCITIIAALISPCTTRS